MKKIWKYAAAFLLLVLLASALTLTAAASGEAETGETAPAEVALAFVKRHLPALLSALTLAATAMLARVFKGSLLPILERGLGRLDGDVETLTEEAKRLLTAAREESERLSECVRQLLSEKDEQQAWRAALKEALQGLSLEQDGLRKMGQTELAMLKEVFTAARLPAASKMALEELYLRIRSEDGESEVGK